jgi:hypothetical protein
MKNPHGKDDVTGYAHSTKPLMTADTFRKMALGFPGTIEAEHMNHPDFRIEGKIFATLGSPDNDWGMVKLTPEQQRSLVKKAPAMFKPCTGVWGERGATNVNLASAKKTVLQTALNAAFKNVTAQLKMARKKKA